MTITLGQQDGSECDPCCPCGGFCVDGLCGVDMGMWATLLGAVDAVPNAQNCPCTGLNGVFNMQWNASTSSVDFNNNRDSLFSFYGVYFSNAAKDGTRTCSWLTVDLVTEACDTGAVSITVSSIETYYGTDDKWYVTGVIVRLDSFANEVHYFNELLNGDGLPVDCENYEQTIVMSKVPAGNFGGLDDLTNCSSPLTIKLEAFF